MDEITQDHDDCCRRSFAASIRDTAKRLLEDPSIAPRRVASLRMEVCEGCDHYIQDSGQCDICLCYMKLKTTMANMKCPLDKWTEYKRED
jgi:hypothetical protein